MAKYQSTLTGPQMDAALAAMPDAEAYARGTRNGQEVQEGDPTYHNNAKYFAQKAESSFPESYATGAVRGDIDQSTQTEEWRAQARENIGITNPVWGNITGDISSQTDLTEVVSPLINQCDEQWESGGINDSTGADDATEGQIRSKNYIKVKASAEYFFANTKSGQYTFGYAYDSNKQFIGRLNVGGNDISNRTQTTPSNCAYVRLKLGTYSGITYENNISINYPSTYTGYYPSALPKAKAHIGGLGNAIAMKGWNQIIPAYLLPATQTINGVTFTNNGDGTITVNGTASADTSLILVSEARVHVKDKGKFIYSGCPHGGSRDTYCMGFSDSVGFADIGNGHYNENYAYNYNLSIIVKSGTQCNNLVFKPNLFLLEPIFGAGNEPLSVKDFRAMFPADYYPYCSGAWADLLWENASLTSAFAAQDLSLDLTGYEYVLIISKASTSVQRVTSWICPKQLETTTIHVNANKICTRSLVAYETHLYINAGWNVDTYGSASQDNSVNIPWKVYGIR